ncbi:MAG: hypothetical protein K0R31_811 [Clostridiales bacterium]|jgi:DNA-binding transcriptional LysR family regulator|nr:hypothetical protein [Clostridiales bacterium]
MHIEYLKVFYEVASAKSISKIAKSSHISQPALSQQIQRLEEDMGFTLLERSNKGVELTEAGQIVDKYSRHILKAFDNMVSDLSNIKKNNCTIRIDASPIVATYALPCTIYNAKKAYPNYNFTLSSAFSEEVEINVANDICQIGFTHNRPTDDGLIFSKVGIDRFVPVAASSFNINNNAKLNDFIKHQLIMPTEQFTERKVLNEYFKSCGIKTEDINIMFDLDSIESVKSTVIKGYGISFLPYISIKKELYTKQLKEIEIPDFNLNYDIYIVYKKEQDSLSNTRELMQYIKKAGEKSFC